MRYQSVEKLLNTYWYSFSDEPIATRGHLTPRLCDPAFLLPEESPDGLWHMFAHTWLGVEHFTSTSGLEWKRQHLLFSRGHSPFILKEGNTYYLLYELHDKLYFSKSKDTRKESRIMISSSSDLSLWSEPKLVLDSIDIPNAKYKEGKLRISRPQLVHIDGHYRLYFGAGEVLMYDTNQKTTARLMCADSEFIEGPYDLVPTPLIGIEPDSEYRNLAVGSVRVVPCIDGLAAVECAYFYDEKRNKSSSAMLLLLSRDGLEWEIGKVMQMTADDGWANRYITSADLRYKEKEDTWYCYYSANGYSKHFHFMPVKESLGLLLGKDD